MKSEIKIPAMGESISEATVGSILTPTGTVVKPDTEILELETDKVNQLLYSPQAGVINLTVKPGDVVKIGQVIGTVESNGQSAKTPKPAPMKEPPPAEKTREKREEPPAQAPEPSKSPPVKMAENVSIRHTQKQFIEELKQNQPSVEKTPDLKSTQKESSKGSSTSPEKETRRKMSKIRQVIARRLVDAQQTTAMLTTFNEVDMTAVIQIREKYKETFIKKYGVKLGFIPFFVRACVAALQAFPDFNSYLEGDEIVHREYYDLGIAVGTDKGVIVPVVRDCDQLSFAEIEQAIDTYAKKAREGSLNIDDLQGGGFTITNGGVYGSLLSTPILNPPQCGILGMHKIEKRPIVIDDQIFIRSMMYVALSYDHRIVDGKEAVSFLVLVKNLLEDPTRLLLDI